MSWEWDKENIWVPDSIRTFDLPTTGRVLYPLELWRTHGEGSHILGSYLTRSGDGNEYIKKTIGLICKTITLIHFICHHCMTKRLCHESVYFHVLRTMCVPDKIVFLFLNLDMVVRNSTPGNFAYIWQRRWDGIITMKIERMHINFLSDLFAGVTVLGSYCP